MTAMNHHHRHPRYTMITANSIVLLLWWYVCVSWGYLGVVGCSGGRRRSGVVGWGCGCCWVVDTVVVCLFNIQHLVHLHHLQRLLVPIVDNLVVMLPKIRGIQ